MRIKIGFSKLSILAQIARARDIVNDMTGNSNFLTPVPALADVTAAIDALDLAFTEALTRDQNKIAIRNIRRKELLVLTSQLAYYVQDVSGGDEEIILSSGYGVVRRGNLDPVGQVLNLRTRNGVHLGSFGALWDRVTGAGAYIVEISDDGETFRLFQVVLQTRVEVTDLVPGQLCYVRVTAVGRTGHGVPSDVSVHNAAF